MYYIQCPNECSLIGPKCWHFNKKLIITWNYWSTAVTFLKISNTSMAIVVRYHYICLQLFGAFPQLYQDFSCGQVLFRSPPLMLMWMWTIPFIFLTLSLSHCTFFHRPLCCSINWSLQSNISCSPGEPLSYLGPDTDIWGYSSLRWLKNGEELPSTDCHWAVWQGPTGEEAADA